MNIKAQIESYERMLGNIEWHIETNGWSIDEKEMRHLKTRVRDYKDFIDVLKKLDNQESERYTPYTSEGNFDSDFEPRQKFKDF